MSDKRVPGRPFAVGNPGRPKGSRNKLGESFITAMFNDFQEHGVDAVQRVRATDPSAYLRVIASLLPKEVTGENGEPLFAGITVTFVNAETEPQS